MRTHTIALSLFLSIGSTTLHAESEFRRQLESQSPDAASSKIDLKTFQKSSLKIANHQDTLSADVQEIIQGEANPKVIELLSKAEALMAEATENLSQHNTSGETIAIETEVIEMIHKAAQEKRKSSGQSNPQDGALMKMLQQMLGEGEKACQQAGKGKGKGQGEAGEGQEGGSNAPNNNEQGDSSGKTETRRLPKKSGSAGTILPSEFNKALDAFNKGLNDAP